MTALDRWLEAAITIILIFGGYSWYFWAQRQTWFKARCLETRWDSRIKYDPRWVLAYVFLYYPMIVLAGWSTPDWHSFAYAAGAFIVLLLVQLQFFLFVPVAIPQRWRDLARAEWETEHGIDTWSQLCMDTVWGVDKLRNSLPSMHVSIATMVDLTIWSNWPVVGYFGGLFPVLIAISALKTKQHFVVDVIPGAVVGAAVFLCWNWLVQ